MSTRPNKNYEQDRLRVARAYKRGTAEFTLRTSYPGPTPPPRCDDSECANRKTELVAVGPTTYSLCDTCRKLCPDNFSYLRSAATKHVVPASKRRQESITAYTAYCIQREHASRAGQAQCPQ